MNKNELRPGRYGFEDLAVGDVVQTSIAEISARLIDQFAEVSGDLFEIHMTQEGAARHGFKDRVAQGLLVLSVVDGLKNAAPAQFDAIASLGWDWQFRAPVLAGDAISARITVLEKQPTSKADRGILTLGFAVVNQRKELVQEGQNRLMVYRSAA